MKITGVKTFIVDGVVRPWTIVKIETGTKNLGRIVTRVFSFIFSYHTPIFSH